MIRSRGPVGVFNSLNRVKVAVGLNLMLCARAIDISSVTAVVTVGFENSLHDGTTTEVGPPPWMVV